VGWMLRDVADEFLNDFDKEGWMGKVGFDD